MTRMDRRREKLVREVERLAGTVKNQHDLDAVLLRYDKLALRTALFQVLKPYLRFPNPQLPVKTIIADDEVAS